MSTIACFLMLSVSLAADGEWEKFDEFDGVSVYRMSVAGNPILKYRGDGVIDAPLAKVLTVVTDTPTKPAWMKHVKHAEVIETITPTEVIEYLHLGTPWPVSDRDFVYRARIEIDRVAKRATLYYDSVEDARRPPQKGRVRARIFPSTIEFIASDGGKRTRVRAEAHADPAGSLPKWLVNLFQKRVPRQSLANLMKRVAEPSIQGHPLAP